MRRTAPVAVAAGALAVIGVLSWQVLHDAAPDDRRATFCAAVARHLAHHVATSRLAPHERRHLDVEVRPDRCTALPAPRARGSSVAAVRARLVLAEHELARMRIAAGAVAIEQVARMAVASDPAIAARLARARGRLALARQDASRASVHQREAYAAAWLAGDVETLLLARADRGALAAGSDVWREGALVDLRRHAATAPDAAASVYLALAHTARPTDRTDLLRAALALVDARSPTAIAVLLARGERARALEAARALYGHDHAAVAVVAAQIGDAAEARRILALHPNEALDALRAHVALGTPADLHAARRLAQTVPLADRAAMEAELRR